MIDVAVIQAAPVMLDREATVDKAVELIHQAWLTGAQLVLFPEAFISAYPRGLSFGAVVGNRSPDGRQLFARYAASAIEIPGPETDRLGAAAQAAGLYLAIGVIEVDRVSGGTLYCTLLFIGPDGNILGAHRKLKPTASERLIWGEGDGTSLRVYETPFGKIGGLICWENYMPLARMALYRQGIDFYLAPTADARASWQATMRHIALEGRCFVLSCNQYVTKAMYPADLDAASLAELATLPDEVCAGGSAIIGPLGEYLAGPVYGREEILSVRLDPAVLGAAKFDFDVVGHYARPDVFAFRVIARTKDEAEALAIPVVDERVAKAAPMPTAIAPAPPPIVAARVKPVVSTGVLAAPNGQSVTPPAPPPTPRPPTTLESPVKERHVSAEAKTPAPPSAPRQTTSLDGPPMGTEAPAAKAPMPGPRQTTTLIAPAVMAAGALLAPEPATTAAPPVVAGCQTATLSAAPATNDPAATSTRMPANEQIAPHPRQTGILVAAPSVADATPANQRKPRVWPTLS